MDEKAMAREESLGKFLVKIGNWLEEVKTHISNFIFIDIMGKEKPQNVAERVITEVKRWNEKYADHCEVCGHNELRTLFWMNVPEQGFKCFECTRCHHKQETKNNKFACLELLKKRICVKPKSQPRYELLTSREQTIIALIAFLLCMFWMWDAPLSITK